MRVSDKRGREKERAENQSELDEEFPRGTIKTERSINYKLKPLRSSASEIYRQPRSQEPACGYTHSGSLRAEKSTFGTHFPLHCTSPTNAEIGKFQGKEILRSPRRRCKQNIMVNRERKWELDSTDSA